MRLGSVLDSLALIVTLLAIGIVQVGVDDATWLIFLGLMLAVIVTLLAIGIVQVGVDDATWLIFLGLMLAVLGLIAKGSRTTSP